MDEKFDYGITILVIIVVALLLTLCSNTQRAAAATMSSIVVDGETSQSIEFELVLILLLTLLGLLTGVSTWLHLKHEPEQPEQDK